MMAFYIFYPLYVLRPTMKTIEYAFHIYMQNFFDIIYFSKIKYIIYMYVLYTGMSDLSLNFPSVIYAPRVEKIFTTSSLYPEKSILVACSSSHF